MLCPLPRRLILQGDRRQEFFPFRVRGCAWATAGHFKPSTHFKRLDPSSAAKQCRHPGTSRRLPDWHPPETPQEGALTHFLACSKLLTNFTRNLRFLSPLPPAIFFFLSHSTIIIREQALCSGTYANRCEAPSPVHQAHVQLERCS